jgi:hypothetical protein
MMAKFKLNKWALAFANAVATFYIAGAAALYLWGEQAICYVEKMHLVTFSPEMLSLDLSVHNFFYGLVAHYIFAYVFVAIAVAWHDRLK